MTDLSNDYPELMTIREVAKALRLHPITLYKELRLAHYVKVPQPAFPRPYRWRRRDIERFIDQASLPDQRRAVAGLSRVR